MSAIGTTTSQYPSYDAQAARQALANKPGYEFDEITNAATEDTSGSASVSLSANLGNTTASTETGWLTLGIARALQTATTVDPATGHRELIAGAGDKLTATINKLLIDSGFTADDAATATANLSQALAQGGQILLASTNDHAVSYTAAGTASNGATSSAESRTEFGEVSNALAIGINLDTGALSVSLKTHDAFVDQNASLQQGAGFSPGAYGQDQLTWETGLRQGTFTTSGGAASPLSETETDSTTFDQEGSRSRSTIGLDQSPSATNAAQQPEQAAPALVPSGAPIATDTTAAPKNDATTTGTTTNDALQRLIASLTDPKIFKATDAANLVKQLSTIADGVRAQVKATAAALDKQIAARQAAAKDAAPTAAQRRETRDLKSGIHAGLGHGQAANRVATVQVGVQQAVSITQTDRQGRGTTLYKRPDGSLGKFTQAPRRLTA